jgi:hypothetical protein
MTHIYYVEQQGMKDYLDGIPISRNPYDRSISVGAHEAWIDGWLDASRARGRYVETLESNRQRLRQGIG